MLQPSHLDINTTFGPWRAMLTMKILHIRLHTLAELGNNMPEAGPSTVCLIWAQQAGCDALSPKHDQPGRARAHAWPHADAPRVMLPRP